MAAREAAPRFWHTLGPTPIYLVSVACFTTRPRLAACRMGHFTLIFQPPPYDRPDLRR